MATRKSQTSSTPFSEKEEEERYLADLRRSSPYEARLYEVIRDMPPELRAQFKRDCDGVMEETDMDFDDYIRATLDGARHHPEFFASLKKPWIDYFMASDLFKEGAFDKEDRP